MTASFLAASIEAGEPLTHKRWALLFSSRLANMVVDLISEAIAAAVEVSIPEVSPSLATSSVLTITRSYWPAWLSSRTPLVTDEATFILSVILRPSLLEYSTILSPSSSPATSLWMVRASQSRCINPISIRKSRASLSAF